MKKIFLSYKFTGEDVVELTQTIGGIVATLRGLGHEVYCSLEDEQWFREAKRSNREIMEHAFEQLDTCDLVLAFIRSNERSEGMLVEIGYALGKGKPIALALKKGITTTSLSQMADPLIEFDSLEELREKLKVLG